MSQQTKTDKHYLVAKLLLRRHFLARCHAEKPPRVQDCLQCSGLLWLKLSREFPLDSYWGVDLKPKKGRLYDEDSFSRRKNNRR